MFIPVSEEWLVKLGFEKAADQDEKWRDSRGLFDFHFSDDYEKFFVLNNDYIGIRPVENVHDLQNVYYFLTGEELVVSGKL